MCSTDFYAFLRVSEMTSTSSVGSPPPIQMGQLFKLADDSGNTIALKLVFANYKHSYNQRPFCIVIHRQPPFCPVQLLLDYLATNRAPLTLHVTRVTTSVLRPPLLLQMGECPMPRSGPGCSNVG